MERHSSVDEEVDWTQYDPPEALNKLPSISSETIIAVVQSALENVRNQIEAERQRRIEVEADIKEEAEAEAAAVADFEASEAAKRKGKEPDSSPPAEPKPVLIEKPVQQLEATKRASRLSRILKRVRGSSDPKGDIVLLTTRPDVPNLPPTPFTKQIYKHLKPNNPTSPEAEVECVSCLDDIPVKSGIKTVCHTYCKSCFIRLIEASLSNETQWPPKCCLNPIPFRTITKHIPSSLLKSYRAKEEEYGIPVEDRLYCPEPDCGLWIRPGHQDPATKRAVCRSSHVVCTLCRAPAHPRGETCALDRDTVLADQLAEEEGWRRCGKCFILVEHTDACQHMRCRCGYEFCYVCDRAARRREMRTREEEEELDEIREALKLVAAFEAEEERKEKVWQEEMRKKREERSRREREERVKKEAARQRMLDKKYAELKTKLAKLDELQRMVLTYTHDREMDETAAGATRERLTLTKKQEREKLELREATTTKLANWMKERELEYIARVALEKQIEDAYEIVLRAFWTDIVGGQKEIRLAMQALMRKNDTRMDTWEAAKDCELEKIKYLLEDEIAIQSELMITSKQRLGDKLAAEGVEVGRKHRAEVRWFELVAAERTRLLAEVEMVERENGAEGSSGEGQSDEGDDLDYEAWFDCRETAVVAAITPGGWVE
ncbi:hypothetical protein DL546_000082 [Coniochaeta pulveracea]|uniref:RBR-type E3 ubiquitin transferase n=1 Tax=Coniochaeta pulveracea TaxID=177199 RepID=A0A420Y0Z4_9PEZI|nr:hypothetical protein DL546_000082 [Coniochaeta pulveracea]